MTNTDAENYITTSFTSRIWHSFKNFNARLANWRFLGWLVLFAAAVNVVFIGGKRRAFGIFISQLKENYPNTTMTELNWIGDSYAALGFFLMPFYTSLLLRLNCPFQLSMFLAGAVIFISCFTSAIVPSPGYLFITHTILHGLGSTMVLCTTSLIIGKYFDKTHKFHVLATTFVSGGPYGVLVFGPLFSRWIYDYGWRKSFEICGIMFLIVTWFAGYVFLPYQKDNYEEVIGDTMPGEENSLNQSGQHELSQYTKTENSQSESKETKESSATQKSHAIPPYLKILIQEPEDKKSAFCSFEHMLKNKQIFLWIVERLLHNFVMYGLMMNLVTYARKHLDDKILLASRINTYFGIGESVIFTAGALVGDRIRGYLPVFYLIGACFAALFLLIVQQTYTDITVLSVLAAFIGASIGSGNTFLYSAAEEIMLIHGSVSFPMTKMIAGVGMVLAPLLSGTIIDKFQFKGFFVSMAILVCIRVVLLCFMNLILYRKKREVIKELKQRASEDPRVNHCCKVTDAPCGSEVTSPRKNFDEKKAVNAKGTNLYESYNQQSESALGRDPYALSPSASTSSPPVKPPPPSRNPYEDALDKAFSPQ